MSLPQYVTRNDVVCKHIVHLSRDQYGNTGYLVWFMQNDKNYMWITTNKSKYFSSFKEGKKYNVKWRENDDFVSYVSLAA